jgi:hypothetical protein
MEWLQKMIIFFFFCCDSHLVVRQVEDGQVLAVDERTLLQLLQRVVAQVDGRLQIITVLIFSQNLISGVILN